MRAWLAALTLAAASCATVQAPPAGTDADTVAWWAITSDLSNDGMEGRDTGSAGYDRAAKYVADRFAAAGLKPAGEGGTFFQTLPLQEVRVEKEETSFAVVRNDGTRRELTFLHEVTVRPTWSLPAGVDG